MISITRSPAAADAEASTNNLVAPTSIPSAESTIDTIEVGRPHELLEIQDSAAGQEEEEEMVYPTGPKLWMTLISLCIALFLHGLVWLTLGFEIHLPIPPVSVSVYDRVKIDRHLSDYY